MKATALGWNQDEASADSSYLFETLYGLSAEEFRAMAETVAIVLPHLQSEGVHGGLLEAASMWSLAGSQVLRCQIPHPGYVEITRASLVRMFLKHCEAHPALRFMVMIDTDESVKWDDVYRLVLWDKPVVSGVVCSWAAGNRGIYACIMVKDKHGVGRFPSVNKTQRMPAAGLVRCTRVGTGFVAVRKDVLDAFVAAGEIPFILPEEVRRKSAEDGNIKLGEDMRFCEQIESLGFEIFADLSVHATHRKSLELTWPTANIDHDLAVEDWDVSEHDYAY